MFLNYLKRLFIKKLLKKSLHNVKTIAHSEAIKKVGLLIDESRFFEKENLVNQIVANGIALQDLKIIVYRDRIKKKEVFTQPTFDIATFNFNGKTTNKEINEFMNEEFDLLINYYYVEKSILLLITNNSKAKFKVGFSSVDKRLNHLMINIDILNYKGFAQELFKYLKILNKI
jgi:hypothetical protein